MKRLIIAMLMTIFCIVSINAQTSVTPAGTGDSANPYQIDSLPNLYWLSTDTSVWSAYFVQNADIDASPTSSWDSDSGFIPVGYYLMSTDYKIFTGRYNGRGHTISGLHINRPSSDNIGLFGYFGGQIDSLVISDCFISGKQCSGGLVGYNYYGKISNCHLSGNVSDSSYVGGIAGFSDSGIISNCSSEGNISGYSNVGGLIGCTISGKIYNCYSTGSVSGTQNSIGGLIGIIESNDVSPTEVINCYVKGNVSGGKKYIGGLIGQNILSMIINCNSSCNILKGKHYVAGLSGYSKRSTISNCYATGNINADSMYIGGLVGYNDTGSIISNCRASENIKGYSYLGGFVGYNENSNIIECYATGNLYSNYAVYAGGFIGYNFAGLISNCYAAVNDSMDGYSQGGFAGYNYIGTIINCYSTGYTLAFNSSKYTGSFTGINIEGTIIYCYATGRIGAQYHNSQYGGFIGYNTYGTISNCYWDINNTGSTLAYGYNGGTFYNCKGLTTSRMRDSSSFEGFDFSSDWTIRKDSTYPALRTVGNNAPFAFADTINANKNFDLQSLLLNDFDMEKIQNSLVVKVTNISAGTTDGAKFFTFPDNFSVGNNVLLSYRIGEICDSTGDTLWGNIAASVIVYDTNAIWVGNRRIICVKERKSGFSLGPNLIKYNLTKVEHVSCKLFGINGRLIYEPVNEIQGEGTYMINLNNPVLPAGKYILAFRAGDYSENKLLHIKR
jgi:hypothetical protein